MRLFLLPVSTRQSLIYCQRLNQQVSTETTYIDKITTKGSSLWLSWEKKESGWQKKITTYGNTLFQRLPYQEWGLKTIPPLSARRKAEEVEGKEEVRLEYPEVLLEPQKVQDTLRVYGSDERQRFHTKWLWGSILGMPITIPFGLIPVMPNLPFFYLCFRAYSHWQAQGGSKHIQFLMDNNLVKTSPSAMLRMAYTEATMDKRLWDLSQELHTISSEPADKQVSGVNQEQMLLDRDSGELIANYLEIPELAVEIKRAVWQVERSLKAKQKLGEEKKELEDATKRPG